MADENSIAPSVQKPSQVKLAISLFYAYAVLNLVIHLTLSILYRDFSFRLNLTLVVNFLINLFLISTISKGKTWARDMFLLMFVASIFANLYLGASIKAELRYQVVVSVVTSCLALIPTVMLYLKPAKEWFENFKQPPSQKT
ncbi:MAG TPA: hypothetical protein PK299_13480 [Anaerolineales bacterium]|nr:hypothetical protein [Anaerolineales bacterium]